MKKASTKGRRTRSENRFLSDLVRIEDGLISPQIFVDPQINRLELERIFAHSWLYVAHESEIPHAGDFVARVMGEDPVIVWRGQDEKIRVFLNVCRHRGRKVCGEDGGKASYFRCPYHGWTYSNRGELISVPFFENYHGRLERDTLGLYQASRVDSYHGLIFANWHTKAEPLSDYLGEMKWALDLMFGRTDGIGVLGPPMRWVVEGNWKLGAANFAADPVHLYTTHGFGAALGLDNKQRRQGLNYKLTTKNGHAASFSLRGSPDDFFLGLPEELRPEMERHLTREQSEVMQRLSTIVGNVFPNMSFLNSSSRLPGEWGGCEDHPISFLNLRLFQPRGANSTEVWSWLFVDQNAPGAWKEASRECYLRTFSMAGVYEQDDTENYVQITQSLRGAIAQRLWLNYKMGLGRPPVKEMPASQVRNLEPWSIGEDNERVFYGHWWKLIMLGETGVSYASAPHQTS